MLKSLISPYAVQIIKNASINIELISHFVCKSSHIHVHTHIPNSFFFTKKFQSKSTVIMKMESIAQQLKLKIIIVGHNKID